ncbi:PGF-CTERM sorting domain-containing protein [Halorubrum sp. DTA46]|uniref:PGF-CTERM sorting domain-containing protein n=1 Tax=Halorubrum sp. DTA46 TaxID=3402162 RepID=UPI003AAE7DD2
MLADDFVTVGANATVESVDVSTPNGTLPPGEYTLAARSEHGSVTTSANETITLKQRATRNVTAYTTTALDPDEPGTAADLRGAIANDTLSASETVTDDDTVVYAVDASGLSGAPAARNTTLDTGSDIDDFDGLSFGVRANNTTLATETLSTSDDDDPIGAVPTDATARVDEDGFYLVAAGDDALATDDPPADGTEFTATFRVDDDRLRAAAAPDDDHVVTTTVTYAVDRDSADDSEALADDGNATGGDTDDGGTDGGGDETSETAESGGVESDGATDETGGAASSDGDGGSGTDGSDGGSQPGRGSLGTDDTPAGQEPEDTDSRTSGELPTDAAPSGTATGARAVADLRVAYRDHPNAVADASATAPRPTVRGNDAGETVNERAPVDADSTPTDGSAGRETPYAEPDSPGYDNAPIRSTAYDVPGFGPVVTLVALVSTALLATRRP